MKRVWVKNGELHRIKDLFRAELNGHKSSVQIPFDKVLPLLEKHEITRILWCRSARSEFARWGLRVGIRNAKSAYRVEIVDSVKWQKAIAGVSVEQPDAPLEFETPSEFQELIPERDPDYVLPDWADHLLLSLTHGDRVMLSGPTGSGKSSLVRELAARQRKPFMRVNLNGECSVADIIGSFKVQAKEMVFQYGPVPKAMRHGFWLCLDELDAALPQVLFCLQSVMEDGGRLHIPETGEWISPHPEFRIVACANTIGKGDESGLYSGCNVLNEAFLDRFSCIFNADYLPAEQEKRLVLRKAKGIDERIVDRMVKVAGDLRKALQDGIIYSSFSTRKLIAWARKSVQLNSPFLAGKYTILNKLTQDDRMAVLEVLQRHFGDLK